MMKTRTDLRRRPPKNLGLDLVRATEMAAIAAARWMGKGNVVDPDRQATRAMVKVLHDLDMNGRIVRSEHTDPEEDPILESNMEIGTGFGPTVDLVVKPIEGRKLVASGNAGAISVVAVAPRNRFWDPHPALYMDKMVVDAVAADALVPECLDAPAAWTLSLISRAKRKPIRDLTVFVLQRPRHVDLVHEIREAGARAILRSDGDVAGALMAAQVDSPVDLLMGVGGVTEGLLAACAVQTMGGAFLGRLTPQTEDERTAVLAQGLSLDGVLTCRDLVDSSMVFFVATAITDGPLLSGVHIKSNHITSESILLRGETATKRIIYAEHGTPIHDSHEEL